MIWHMNMNMKNHYCVDLAYQCHSRENSFSACCFWTRTSPSNHLALLFPRSFLQQRSQLKIWSFHNWVSALAIFYLELGPLKIAPNIYIWIAAESSQSGERRLRWSKVWSYGFIGKHSLWTIRLILLTIYTIYSRPFVRFNLWRWSGGLIARRGEPRQDASPGPVQWRGKWGPEPPVTSQLPRTWKIQPRNWSQPALADFTLSTTLGNGYLHNWSVSCLHLSQHFKDIFFWQTTNICSSSWRT